METCFLEEFMELESMEWKSLRDSLCQLDDDK